MRRTGQLDNLGINRVERLDGNIGYLDCAGCRCRRLPAPRSPPRWNFVAGTYAHIIDLRRNGGGSPYGVALWCSYLIAEQPMRLNDIFYADSGETRQFWSYRTCQAAATPTARCTC